MGNKINNRVSARKGNVFFLFSTVVDNNRAVNSVRNAIVEYNSSSYIYCTCIQNVCKLCYVFGIYLNGDCTKTIQATLCNLNVCRNFDNAARNISSKGCCLGIVYVVNNVAEVVVAFLTLCRSSRCRNVNVVDAVAVDENALIGHNSGGIDSFENLRSQVGVVALNFSKFFDCTLICICILAHVLENCKESCDFVVAILCCHIQEIVALCKRTGCGLCKAEVRGFAVAEIVDLFCFQHLIVGKKLYLLVFGIVPEVVAVLCALGVELLGKVGVTCEGVFEICLGLNGFALRQIHFDLRVDGSRHLCVGTDVCLFNDAAKGWNHNRRQNSNYRNYDNKLYNGKCSAFVVTYHLCFSFFLQKIFACFGFFGSARHVHAT